VGFFLICFYGSFALIALINLAFMKRGTVPRHLESATPTKSGVSILIPARNEETNLARLLPALLGPGSEGAARPKVYVFDDESEDKTAEIARANGAILIRPREPLPEGWTGKNRACHELAKAAAEDSDAEWILFLDADVYPAPGFVAGVEQLTRKVSHRTCVISGFPNIISGRGIEPLFLAWVGWVLLTTNPYGLVSLTGKGHNRFTNGQFGCWRSRTYTELWPNETLKGRILEDVLIGRLCAERGIGVEVVNLSAILSVKMYETWRETLDGMSKNSYEITGSVIGSLGIAAFFLFVGWGWLLGGRLFPYAALLFALSGLISGMIVRVKPYGLPLLPVALTVGSFTILRSMVWHKKGLVTWKGRTYSS
jgi:glycosyltransferase involved in cell wall biosynthesis